MKAQGLVALLLFSTISIAEHGEGRVVRFSLQCGYRPVPSNQTGDAVCARAGEACVTGVGFADSANLLCNVANAWPSGNYHARCCAPALAPQR